MRSLDVDRQATGCGRSGLVKVHHRPYPLPRPRRRPRPTSGPDPLPASAAAPCPGRSTGGPRNGRTVPHRLDGAELWKGLWPEQLATHDDRAIRRHRVNLKDLLGVVETKPMEL